VPGRFDLSPADLAALLPGEPAYRARQVWRGLHLGRSVDELTELPKALRARLARDLPPPMALLRESVAEGSAAPTVKWLWGLDDGARIETVLMTYPGRATVCVSSQAGCAMACPFCATGQAGFRRHLSAGEIVEQVVRARSFFVASQAPGARHATKINVVLMGMGEPLANYDAVWAAVERVHGDLGISARHITVSTVGIVPGIRRLAGERLPVNLAVSLHAADDALRNRLVPVNKRYPLAALTEACRQWVAAKGRRLSFEWALIDGVNDRPADAAGLARLALPLRAHVNLIPLNPTPGYPGGGTPPAGVRAFRDRLRAAGVNATVRRNRGTDIDAACGQLAAGAAPAPLTANR
jgi:23S rRNA (adenine2503-C2)-methyltransferase